MSNKISQALRARARHDEKGAVLLTVTLLSVFIFSVVLAIAASSAFTSQLTNNSRSTLKAFAAAESGRDSVLTELTKGTCVPTGTQAETTTKPGYTWAIYRYKSLDGTTPTTTTQSGVTAGCPLVGDTHVLVRASGLDPTGTAKVIVSTYEWHPAVTTINNPFGGAVVSYNGLTISNFDVIMPSGGTSGANVTVANGAFKCEGAGSSIAGGAFVQAGNIENLGGCTGLESVSASGYVKVNKYGAPKVVNGEICAESTVTLYDSGSVGGPVRQNQTACPGQVGRNWVDYRPTVPGSVNISSDALCQNQTAPGAPEGVFVKLIETTLTPTVFDASYCKTPAVLKILNPAGGIQLKTDITLVGDSFDLENFTVSSADGLEHMFNVVVPDKSPNSHVEPKCQSQQDEMKILQVNMTAPMKGLIYSPCWANQLTLNWIGQIYLGELRGNISNGSLLYKPIFPPGIGSSGDETVVAVAAAEPVLLAQTEP